jgi:hypothetical protein
VQSRAPKVRRGPFTWGCGLAAGLAACAAGPRPHDPATDAGWSDRPPAAPVERWDLAGQLRALHPAAKRARSEHLGGDLEGEVLANTAAGAYPPRGPASKLPPGATLVERLSEPGSNTPMVYFVMVKQPPGYDPPGGDWEYLTVVPDGRIEKRGKMPLCARCHAEAPHEHLFGGGR